MARPARIDRDAILAEAAALLAQGGMAAVTLRGIAARLGVQAPSLARHVGDKANLAALLTARIFAEALDGIEGTPTGAAWLRAYGIALWEKQLATRDIALLLATPLSEEIARTIRAALAARMAAAGLSGAKAEDAQSAIQALVTGWASFARGPNAARYTGSAELERRFIASLDALIAGFGPLE